jgi:hypothetical protein
MRFSYEFSQASPGTTLEVLLDGIPVYVTSGNGLSGKGLQVSDWIEMTAFAGRQVILAFRVSNPVEGSKATVTLDDLVVANIGPAGGPFSVASAPTVARQGSVVLLDGTNSLDPDPGPQDLAYVWTQLHGSFVQLDLTNPAKPFFTASSPGPQAFALTVNDGLNTSLPSPVAIQVPELGDIDIDGDVDVKDLILLTKALGQPASGANDLKDLDGDGRITGLDIAVLAKKLRNKRAPQPLPPKFPQPWPLSPFDR